MAEDTTTTTAPQEDIGAPAQPVAPAEPVAADVPTVAEPSTDDTSDESESQTPVAPEADEKLQKYAASQGFELDSPGAIKAAQAALKAQSEATKNHQRASELEKTLTPMADEYAETVATATGESPELLKRLQRVEVKEAVRDFWNQDGIDRAYEPQMIKLLADKPHLAGDLESLYATAVMKSGGVAATKSQGSREALQKLAHAQQAAVPTGNATTSSTTPKAKPFAELSISEMEAQLGFAPR